MHYACELLLRRILAGRPEEIQLYILNYFGYTNGDWKCVTALATMFAGYTLLGWFVLLIRMRL